MATPFLLAAPTIIIPMASSIFIGAAVFVLSRTARNTLSSDDLDQDDQWRYDVTRINELRKVSPLYRAFYPLVVGLARFNRRAFRDSLPEIRRQIQASGMPRFWTPEEYLGRIQVIAIFLAPIYSYLCISMMGPPGIILGMVGTFMNGYWLRHRLRRRAADRLFAIKKRLPFLLDLLTLLMEAGATFLNALRDAVEEFRDHPVGVEFGRVLAELSMGKSRTASLESLRDRLSDDEITSIIGSIVQGEDLGTPLALLFRTQADVLRMKRTQRAETLAGEAGVKMLLPAVLVMGATVIVILGPFLLSFFYADFMS